jgi:hypothetical protein
MKRMLCLLRGGHKPMRTSISTNRIFCRRCGCELQYVARQPPSPRDETPTTLKPRQYPTLRAFGRLAQPGSGTSHPRPAPEERPEEELPRA